MPEKAENACKTCGDTFASRTKLFLHLKTPRRDGMLSRCNEAAQASGVKLLSAVDDKRRLAIFFAWRRGSHADARLVASS